VSLKAHLWHVPTPPMSLSALVSSSKSSCKKGGGTGHRGGDGKGSRTGEEDEQDDVIAVSMVRKSGGRTMQRGVKAAEHS
jgi:hypothetical protein